MWHGNRHNANADPTFDFNNRSARPRTHQTSNSPPNTTPNSLHLSHSTSSSPRSVHQNQLTATAKRLILTYNLLFPILFEALMTYTEQGRNQILAVLQFVWATYTLWRMHMSQEKCPQDAKWLSRLQEFNITWETLDLQMFHQHHTVYLRYCSLRNEQYTGMTDDSIMAREGNRKRKFYQQGLVNKEPALKVWHRRHNYFQYVTIPVVCCGTALASKAMETLLISRWKPQLNWPYVLPILRNLFGIRHFSPPPLQPLQSTRTTRLFQRRRRQHLLVAWRQGIHDEDIPNTKDCKGDPLLQSKRILVELTQKGLSEFHAQQRLRHHAIKDTDLYMLHRHALTLTQPDRDRATYLIRQAMKYRSLPVPTPTAILRASNILPTCIPALKQACQHLKQTVRPLNPPYHPISFRVIEAANRSIGDILFNFRQKNRPTLCTCHLYKEEFADQPRAWSKSGHLCLQPIHLARLTDPTYPCRLQSMALAPLPFYNTKHSLWDTNKKATTAWQNNIIAQLGKALQKSCNQQDVAKFNNITTAARDKTKSILQTAIAKGCAQVKQQTNNHLRELTVLINLRPSLIFHIGDHCHTKLHAFCPQHHFDLTNRTFEEAEIFKKVNAQPETVAITLWNNCDKDLKRSCKWAFRNMKLCIPGGYILAKEKKNWDAARSIVTYSGTTFAALLRAAGIALTDITSWACDSSHFNTPSATIVRDKLQQYNDMTRRLCASSPETWLDCTSPLIIADDLAGFFPSPPPQLMTNAIDFICHRATTIKNLPLDEIKISFQMTRNKLAPTSFGKQKDPRYRTLTMTQLRSICLHALTWAVVHVNGTTYQQVRGGAIGSPLSPAWLVCLVMHREYTWLSSRTIPVTLRNETWQTIRYVDNRMILTFQHNNQPLTAHDLLHKNFYGDKIILEVEPKDVIIGVELIQLTTQLRPSTTEVIHCRLKIPGYTRDTATLDENFLWRYRTPSAGGTIHNLLSPLKTKIHQAMTLSFPDIRRQQAIARLVWIYICLGFQPKIILQCLDHRIPDTWTTWRATLSQHAIHNPQLLHTLTGCP